MNIHSQASALQLLRLKAELRSLTASVGIGKERLFDGPASGYKRADVRAAAHMAVS